MYLILILLFVFFIVQSIAFITLYERHLLGSSQNRLGPNKVSFMGLLQAIMDGVKLLKKEQLLLNFSSELLFLFVPSLSFILMFFEWLLVPYVYTMFDFGMSFLMLMMLVGFSVYGLVLSGFFSNSKYGFIGSIRACSQSVSFEIAFSFYLMIFVILVGGLMFFIMDQYILVFLIYIYMFMILAELNRAPFDFSEGESELVSGYNIEFSSVSFVLLFLGEYGSLIFFCVLGSLIFFNLSIFFVFLLFSVVIFIRSSYPRYRYDFLMSLFWLKILPVVIFVFLFYFYMFLY